jgi:hypothetical protein
MSRGASSSGSLVATLLGMTREGASRIARHRLSS